MSKFRFIFIVLIVGIFYAYKEIKKTYRQIPTSKSTQGQAPTVENASSIAGILKAKSNAQQREVFYKIVIDRFFDGDKDNLKEVDPYNSTGFHGGDLKGISEKLDYIKSVGVTSILISNPMLQNKTPRFYVDKVLDDELNIYPYRGEKPTHLTKVDPLYGSMSDLKDLADDAHAKGLKLYVELNLSELQKTTPLLDREDGELIFDTKANACYSRTPEDLLVCFNPGWVRFNHSSKVAQKFLQNEILKLQSETNIDGILLQRSQMLNNDFVTSFFYFINGNLKLKDFRLMFDYSFTKQPFFKEIFRGESTGFIQYDSFTRSLIDYLKDSSQRDTFINQLRRHSGFRLQKYLVSDFTAGDTMSLSAIYNNDLSMMIKHVAVLGFAGMNVQMNYGEELAAEYGRFPYTFPDMPWENIKKSKKFKSIIQRVFTSRTNTKDFNSAYGELIYNKEGLFIFAKLFNEQIVGLLAINETDEDKVIYHELEQPLRSPSGVDQINNSKIEKMDNGITFNLGPKGVQFITF